MAEDNMYMRYFMFSRDHYNKVMELEKASGNRNYKFGNVIVSGTSKKYTMIARDPDAYIRKYPDAITIIKGDIRKIKYTEPEESD